MNNIKINKEPSTLFLIFYMLVLIIALTLIADCFFHFLTPNEHKNELYYNYNCKIVAVQDPVEWNHGKFRGIDREWLIQSQKDTTMYTRFFVQNDSMWFNHKNGDMLHFDYIRKDRFFKINKRNDKH